MPSPHIVRHFEPESYYHIYNQGAHGLELFKDETDYATFLGFFKRHLTQSPQRDRFGRQFAPLSDKVKLLAFCLLPGSFHLLIFNVTDLGMAELMQRTMTAYSMYYNKKYRRRGPLFQSTYKASRLSDETLLSHITRYIHLLSHDISREYSTYPNSSYKFYAGHQPEDWVDTGPVLAQHHGDRINFSRFASNKNAMQAELAELKKYLADQ